MYEFGCSKEMVIFLSRGDFVSSNQSGVNIQRANIPVAIWINLENFQDLFGNLWKSLGNILFSFKSSRKIRVYLGFSYTLRHILIYYLRYRKHRHLRFFFLLLMEENLAEVLQGSRTKGKGIVPRQNMKEGQSSGTRQHHNDLAEKLMPLLAPSVPPGFEPHPTMVAPEAWFFSTVMGEGASTKETDQSQPQKDDGNEIMGRLADTGGFVMGSNSQLSGERSSKSWNSKQSKPSWTRRNQTNRRLSQSGQSQRNGDREDAMRKKHETSEKSPKRSHGRYARAKLGRHVATEHT
ncbi:hypothetical protein F2Q69_00042649 [Brassica cretica]|uniref:DUF4283 domain-containing protein n=1 Tax=Brassica cretica TaxID=69181 RepID=A0A8S9NPB0_BRACR|nr:hypothetical protein F2Q69_00042649 [Brassica cretica]